jgi:hypothetical protein
MVFFAGRIGDALYVDGRLVGRIPVRTVLSEGEHAFAVEGDMGRFQVTRSVKLKSGTTTMLHLDK